MKHFFQTRDWKNLFPLKHVGQSTSVSESKRLDFRHFKMQFWRGLILMMPDICYVGKYLVVQPFQTSNTE